MEQALATLRYTGCKLPRQSGTARALPKTPKAARLRPARIPAIAMSPAASPKGPDSLRCTPQIGRTLRRHASVPLPESRPCTLATVRLDFRSVSEESAQFSARAGATRVSRTSRPGTSGQCGTHHRLRGCVGTNERLRLTVLVPARLWPRLANPLLHTTHIVRSFRSFLAPLLYS